MGGALRPATAEDAPAIHALIAKYQAAGRLLPRPGGGDRARTRDPLPRRRRDARRGDVRRAARSWRRCRRPSPRCVRSWWTSRRAAWASAALLVDTLADEARLAGFRTVCAFTHDPAYFVRLGYSLVPHAWLPEKIAHDCAGCTLFRRCGQDAVRLQLAERGRRAHERVRDCRRHHGRRRASRAAGVAAGIKASGALDVTLIVADAAGVGRGGLHDQPGAGGAGPGLARARRRQRRTGARGHRQQRLRQRLHRRPGPGDDARDGGARSPSWWAVRSSRCWSPPPASSACTFRSIRWSPAPRPPSRRSSRDGHTAARGIMTTDPGPKEFAVQVETPAGAFRVGGIAKGAGMIEPMMATMLAFVTTDAAVAPALLRPRAARGDRPHVQRDHGGRRVLDQRHVRRAGQRRQRRRPSTRRNYGALVEGLEAVARALALAIVRGGEGATKLVAVHVTGADSARRRDAGGQDHRQLAAGEDGHSRRRSELGPPGLGRRAVRARASCSSTRACRWGRSCSSGTASRLTIRRRRPRSTCGRPSSTSTWTSAPGRRTAPSSWTCDLSAEYVRINGEYRT